MRNSPASGTRASNAWWPPIIRKLRKFVTMKTAKTSSGNAVESSGTSQVSISHMNSSPPTSGKVANAARLAMSSGSRLRART